MEAAAERRAALARRLLGGLGARGAAGGAAWGAREGLRALAGPGRPQPRAWERLDRDVGRFGRAAFVCAAGGAERRIPGPGRAAGGDPRCRLGRRDFGRKFWDESLGEFVAELFKAVCLGSGAHTGGAPAFTLSPWDLYHCHAIRVRQQPHNLALLFHALEYPARSEEFPVNLGFCQSGSPVAFSPDAMAVRNALYFAGQLVLLDLSPGSALAREHLVREGLELTQTVYEGDFGECLGDINFLPSCSGGQEDSRASAADALYLCW